MWSKIELKINKLIAIVKKKLFTFFINLLLKEARRKTR